MDIKKTDKHSNTGVSGSPKKGGAGGKGTWGTFKDDTKGLSKENPKDPNYDSEDEQEDEVVLVESAARSPFAGILKEFLVAGDVDEALKSLKDLNMPDQHHQVVKEALRLGLESHAFERELLSKLLSSAYPDVVAPPKIVQGFQDSLNSLEDSSLDSPDAVDVLSKFLARAVLDEIVAPIYLQTAVKTNSLAEECIGLAKVLLNDKNRGKKLEHVWGPGDLHSVKRLKEEAAQILREFLLGGDSKEADQSLRQLNAPHFHFQFVKEAVRMALGKDEPEQNKLLALLAGFSQSGLISSEQMESGFKVCYDVLDDLRLDSPNAPALLKSFVANGKNGGWISSTFEEAVPV